MAFFCAPVLGPVLSFLVGAKVLGYVASVVTAPTNNGTRTLILDHVERVISSLDKAGIGIAQSDRISHMEDVEVLRRGIEMGWTEDYETPALGRIVGFLSVAHTKSTGYGVSTFASSHLAALGDGLWKWGKTVLDEIAPKKF